MALAWLKKAISVAELGADIAGTLQDRMVEFYQIVSELTRLCRGQQLEFEEEEILFESTSAIYE